MASDVSISNLALSHLGKGRINALAEDSAEARQCALHYPVARDALLASYPWAFARRVESLAPKPNAWAQRWAFAYQRPADCLRIIRLVPDVDPLPEDFSAPHQLRGRVIFCNTPKATLDYVARTDDASLFPPLFVDALSWALAARLAMPLTREAKAVQNALTMAASSAATAMAHDANEDTGFLDLEAEALTARSM
ncbi:hypothetical protein GCM10007276_34400 [Agaricicola taiwanensis]|uniref:Uncharacterized protein n=1 Tax=Agaricicola taiwanensis TaxID=591372 RepID=A0A8J3E0H4_9RHOB|nr:hypothetical protein [Agaricicola taiwanensis]GGE54444.1 hypothetical protein GCM10007276_34400 [Agaricicola taiwanensis]